ncbi:a2aa6c0d-9326-435c-9c79-2614c11b7958 [Thermothielavioides terrestris]|uniref:Nucleoporin NUP188 n=2 Tax=Thermothielavioides terrestris TaxID=2587410 RepID=G2RA32_THETT|nr:uncharacterized protein THITE_2096857 [Thermothielavioides terrestris NRRL 8126]AEO69620.1 hypothetical protein THITE_2096857 [Thermothielavioides terrestris NRRL 8126]SPQ26139.1 a2aa6c0d-9326-435c-9c79-2614c11b7958 [Thermothielavioides terrestris]
MATLTDRTYLPPLEECLSGREIILSWRLVASALEDRSCDRLTSAAVSAFLRDGFVHQLLREPALTFAPPTNQSKLDFETKTGAINIVPSPSDPYNLDTLKDDARWLSKNAHINELAALRIVLVEYQSRALSHLTGPLSTQDVTNIQEAAGVGDAQASAILALLNVTAVVDAEATWADFESDIRRRQRLLATYLSERRSFLGAVDALLTFLIYSRSSAAPPELDRLRRAVVVEAFGFDEDAAKPDTSRLDALAPTYIRVLDDCVKRTQAAPESLDKEMLTDAFEVDWIRTALTEAIHAMSLVFQILDLKHPTFAPPELVVQWFALMDECEFFESVFAGHELIAELILPLRSLVAVVSLKFLNIDRALAHLDQDVDLLETEDPYLASSDALTAIHSTIAAAAGAGLLTTLPVVFAWSLILHQMHLGYQERAERRDLLQNQRAQAGFELEYEPASRQRRNSAGSIVSIEACSYDLFLASQQLERNIEPAENMAKVATARGQVYDLMAEMALCLGSGQLAAFRTVLGARARLAFQDLLRRSSHYVGYQAEPVSCLLSTLSGGAQYWDISLDTPSDASTLAVYTRMLKDDALNVQYTSQSQNRFPYEFLPFASLCRILTAALVADEENSETLMALLLRTPSLTVNWDPRWDTSYELVFEEENTNSFRLTRDIDLFDSTLKFNRHLSPEEKCTIPRGTFGRFVTDVGRVAKLEFEHSVLALFGKRLEANLMAGAYETGLGFLTVDELVEGISLLATVLRAEALRSSKADSDRGLKILAEASRLLPRGKDIISIVCDAIDSLVEEELVDLDSSKIAALTSCLQFLHAAVPVCPGRVWSYMARCALINSDTRSGRLPRITANLDVFAERFDLLLSAVKLFSSLIDSAMTSTVQRRTGLSLSSRSHGEENPWIGASDKILSRVSLSIAQTALDVFENSATWRFPSEVDRSVLVQDVVGIMHKLVSYTHSVGSADAPKSLTSSLAPAAGYVVESFLSSSSSSLRFQPLLATLLAAFQLPDSTLYQRRARIVSERLTTVLDFATILLRVADYLGQASGAIQTQLFKSASLIARLPAIRHSFRMPAISLLSALVESAGKASGEPPSLLGYLGPQISRSFIQIASQLDKPFNRTAEVVSTWKFFSTILRNRQQWMANCLLTGKTPREALKGDAKISQLSAGSVLSTALERLSVISKIPSQESLAVLDFFTSAQNYWPWTIFAMQKDRAFLQDLRSYVRQLKAPAVMAKADPAEACYQARIAAYIAETFAMQLYHLRQMRQEQAFAAEVVNDLDYFLRDGVQVADYNASLHVNFARNFAKRYPGCAIDDFKRTLLVPRDLGSQYYYALDVAEAMLGYDAGWAGSKQNGFRREMETANLNLSLVEAEVALFHAWEYLLLELSICLLPKKNHAVARQMLQVVEQCLESNQRPQPPENIFVVLAHSRANLALTLLQRLADCSLLPKDITQLLSLVAATINGVEDPWSKAQISYFRTLLKILFVTLRGTKHSSNAPPQKTAAESPVAVSQLVLTILDRVVARSFRTLAALVHEPGAAATPEDLALITAILQACLSVPGIEQCQLQVLNIASSHDILQVATSLFSWSDRLADKGDPVYGELALLLLVELSALPAVAEQFACDGLLGHLTSASLAGFMRRANVSPFADNPGAARCYAVWAKGVLPLLLNVLGALGATIAPEVAFVLNQFPNLLRASVERLEAPGFNRTASAREEASAPHYVALVAVGEAHSLALLTRVLAALRASNARDIPEVAWDAAAALENVEFWLASRKLLRERLLPLGPREVEWRGTRAAGASAAAAAAEGGAGCENRLEEKVVALLEGIRDVLAEEGE